MPKTDTAAQSELQVVPAEPTAKPLAVADYKLVGLDPEARAIHIPELNREYSVAELEQRLDLLEYLSNIGWPHVEKSRK